MGRIRSMHLSDARFFTLAGPSAWPMIIGGETEGMKN